MNNCMIVKYTNVFVSFEYIMFYVKGKIMKRHLKLNSYPDIT